MQEFVVIGAGLAGAATAWRLASRGHSVTILERSTPGNDEGSSHGSARIIRFAYPNSLYTGLVVRARDGWDELEHESGQTLITPTGSLDHGALRPVLEMAAILEAYGVEHELVSASAAEVRWPQLHFDSDVLWQPEAGILDAITTVEAMIRLATATGLAELRTDWPVSRVAEIPSGYRIMSARGQSVDAANVIVTAGGWLPNLLGELSLPSGFLESFPTLEVRQEQAVHFPYWAFSGGATKSIWPTFIYKGADIQTYGLPGGRDAGFRGQKVAQFNGGRVIESAQYQDGVVDPAARRRLAEYAERAIPGVDPTPYAETTCLFTSTPTEDFVFDRVDGITVVSPCSGHGGKFAPLLGELAADLASGSGEVPVEFRVAAHSRASTA